VHTVIAEAEKVTKKVAKLLLDFFPPVTVTLGDAYSGHGVPKGHTKFQ
jgi:hypothetical protein